MTRLTYRSTTTGLFPLPDGAKDDLLALKGRQKDDLIDGSEGAEIRATYDEARTRVIEWQQAAGLDRIVEGQLRWDDMLAHPLAVHEAVETGGLRRYYDNNNFYREMRVTGPLTPDGDLANDLRSAGKLVADDRLQVVLPGPVSLFDLATDDHYGDPKTFLGAIADFLAEEIASLPPVETCLLLEPSLAGEAPPIDVDVAVEAVDRVSGATDDAGIAETILHVPWGVPADSLYRELRGIEELGLGYDLVSSRAEARALVAEYGAPSTVALGVVDGQNTRVEEPDELRAIAQDVIGGTGVETAYLSFNVEGFYLPTGRFREKLQALGAATQAEVTA